MANVELLDKVMKFIEHNEHAWNQNSWARVVQNGFSYDEMRDFIAEDPQNPLCGTQRCFAGHTVAFEGWLPLFEPGDRTTYDCQNKAGDKADIGVKARELLGIDNYTADLLFAGANDLEDLRAQVEYIKEHGHLTRDWDHKDIQCPDCEGTGQVEDSCFECGHSTTVQCNKCDGSGEITVDRDGDQVY